MAKSVWRNMDESQKEALITSLAKLYTPESDSVEEVLNKIFYNLDQKGYFKLRPESLVEWNNKSWQYSLVKQIFDSYEKPKTNNDKQKDPNQKYWIIALIVFVLIAGITVYFFRDKIKWKLE